MTLASQHGWDKGGWVGGWVHEGGGLYCHPDDSANESPHPGDDSANESSHPGDDSHAPVPYLFICVAAVQYHPHHPDESPPTPAVMTYMHPYLLLCVRQRYRPLCAALPHAEGQVLPVSTAHPLTTPAQCVQYFSVAMHHRHFK